MRIGVYSALASKPAGNEDNVSGHTQLAIETAARLAAVGHQVEFITTSRPPGYTFPRLLPSVIRAHEVFDARANRNYLIGSDRKRTNPSRLFRQVRDIRRIATERDLEVLHFFGFAGSTYLAAAVKGSRRTPKIFVTLPTFHGRASRGFVAAMARIDGVATATQYAVDRLSNGGTAVSLIRHGPSRSLRRDGAVGPRNRVLYWRDLSWQNGADLCLRVFEESAPRHPDLVFSLALRHCAEEVPGLNSLLAGTSNIAAYRHPYESGPQLEDLMAEALVVVLPFRSTSVDPQMVILESLEAGVPVLTTQIASNPEIIRSQSVGWLVRPGSTSALADGLETAITERAGASSPSDGTSLLPAQWTWDRYVDDTTSFYHGH